MDLLSGDRLCLTQPFYRGTKPDPYMYTLRGSPSIPFFGPAIYSSDCLPPQFPSVNVSALAQDGGPVMVKRLVAYRYILYRGRAEWFK